jgi:hypothetical protein
VRGSVAGKRVEGGETGVAGGSAVSPVRLKVIEEHYHPVGVEISEVELKDEPLPMHSDEAQEEHERVAVAEDGVRAHTTDTRQMLDEENTECAGERVGGSGAHWPPPSLTVRRNVSQCRSNRPLASATGSRRER